MKCADCKLQYRFPKDTPEFLNEFYQSDYEVDSALITTLPSDDELNIMVERNFPDARDFSPYIEGLGYDSEKSEVRVIDFGCSWGYSVFKAIQSGYNCQGFELSTPRAEFGRRKLDLRIVSDVEQLPDDCHFIISSHVVEHLSDLRGYFQLAKEKLRSAGFLMSFCPNGSPELRVDRPDVFRGNWGLEHVNVLSIEFAERAFEHCPYLILTGDRWSYDMEEISRWDGCSQYVGGKRNGEELFIAARPNY